ncbi:glycoside hydrolase family 1 protein [Stutzerimonas chloritidismutans]|uniref:beta-glucosidase n=1 Tax=Stutzerimonas chloritidismutans TaxID=203192 RepID=UPI003F16B908
MHQPSLFDSFFLGGFECSTHRRSDGRRLDLLVATGHDRWAAHDYGVLQRHGIRSVRDGLRWHLIEQTSGHYDWSSFLPMLQAAHRQGTQVIWDLCHYGWPDDLDIWRPQFVERFARFAAAAAQLVKDETDGVPFYAPVNEISFWSWAGGDEAYFNPMARGRGFELKHQLVRASIAAIEAIRDVEPRARFVQVDPAIHVTSRNDRPGPRRAAEDFRLSQFQGWDMLTGELWPGLGGAPQYLDIIGVNYYSDNQWYHEDGQTIPRDSTDYRPFKGILREIAHRYKRPILIAETGAEGDVRGDWLRYVSEQAGLAMQAGVQVEGICLYPVLDYPGWTDDRHCPVGLLGFADDNGNRCVHQGLADELRLQQMRFHQTSPAQHIAEALS